MNSRLSAIVRLVTGILTTSNLPDKLAVAFGIAFALAAATWSYKAAGIPGIIAGAIFGFFWPYGIILAFDKIKYAVTTTIQILTGKRVPTFKKLTRSEIGSLLWITAGITIGVVTSVSAGLKSGIPGIIFGAFQGFVPYLILTIIFNRLYHRVKKPTKEFRKEWNLRCQLGYPERKFAETMKERGRFKDWSEIKESPCEGTLIIEQAQKDGCRIWWTPDDVAKITPHQIPQEEQLDYLRIHDPLPFVQWCYQNYTSPHSGKALLTEAPFTMPHGFLTTDFLRTKGPTTNVIATVKVRRQKQ